MVRPLARFLTTLGALILILGFAPRATGAPAQLQFDAWTTENGLPQNSINEAATEDGMLIRYRDGRFLTYTTADGLPHALGITLSGQAGQLISLALASVSATGTYIIRVSAANLSRTGSYRLTLGCSS
jgi:hypothetical protein